MRYADVKGVVFDLDGTLVDSVQDLHAISSEILHNLGFTPYSLDEVRGFIGHGIRHLVNTMLDGRNFSDAEHEREAVLERFMDKYNFRPAVHSTLYPGAQAFLTGLRDRGVKISICTNKQQDIAEKVVEALGLNAFISSLVGAGRTEVMKPGAEPVQLCLSEMGVDAQDAVYIGDSEVDEATAKAAGLPFILFEGGYRHQSVQAFAAKFTFSRFDALAELFDEDSQVCL